MSSRTSANPSSTCAASNRVASTLESPNGRRVAATASVRGLSADWLSGDDTDQPPSRARMAVAPAATVVRSSLADGEGLSAPPAGPPV